MFFFKTSIKTFRGIPSGAGFFPSTVYNSKPAASHLFRNQLKGAKLFVFSGTTISGVKKMLNIDSWDESGVDLRRISMNGGCLQGGPLQVINRVITPINGLING